MSPATGGVVVVGGGIAGASAALALAGAGMDVVLLERGARGGEATPASAGMLASQIEVRTGDPLQHLTRGAHDAYRRLRSALTPERAGALEPAPGGILRVALSHEEADQLEAQVETQRSLGLTCEWLDARQLRARQPLLAPAVRGALLAPRDGCIDPAAMLGALRDAAVARGARIVRAEAHALETLAGRVKAVRTDQGTLAAAWAVLAAGAWSAQLRGLPRPLPLQPMRGQILLTGAPAGWEPQVLFGPGGYIVPRRGKALLGSTTEYVGFDASTTAEGLGWIREACSAVLPALDAAPTLDSWAGLRPVTPDALPILGPDPDLTGLIYATGYGRSGILIGPLAGEIVRDVVIRGETTCDLRPYSIGRFEGEPRPAREPTNP